MKIPFVKKEKVEEQKIWAIIVPEEKWTKGATLLRDKFKKDHIVVDRIEDVDETLKAQLSFFSTMNEYVKILTIFDKNGIEVIEDEPEEEPEEEKKEVKKKK